MHGITHIDNFIAAEDANILFDDLLNSVSWDSRMTARKTASYGKAYNYSQISYPYQELLPVLNSITLKLKPVIGFEANNCLINYYVDGNSKMGYHSDQIDILENDTGIAIVSLGAERVLKFRNILDENNTQEYCLNSGSLVYMTQDVQKEWKHAIPKSKTNDGRLSLTFRAIK